MSEIQEPLLKPLLTEGEAVRYTPEDIAKINVALEATKGNRDAAARILGVPRRIIQDLIQNRPELKSRWGTSNAVEKPETDEISSISRTGPKEIQLSQAEKKAAALAVQERKMKLSLGKLGFKQNEIATICAVEEFAGQHFKQTLSIMHGSMLRMAMRLLMIAQRIEETYLMDESLEEKERKYWWEQYFEIIEKIRLMNSEANKAALTRALVEIKKNEKEGKAGFAVPAVAIQINSDKPTNVSAGKTGEPDAL